MVVFLSLALVNVINVLGGKSILPVRGQDGIGRTLPKTPAAQKGRNVNTDGELKELAAGNRSGITESFVVIARDPQTYAALRSLYGALPEYDVDFFSSHAVVAAFMGQRRTSGYVTSITRDRDGTISILEQAPARGAMVKMVLSTPFKIVAVPIGIDAPLSLNLDTTWRNRLRSYRLTGGEVVVTGGFAGIRKKYHLAGQLSVMRAGSLATFFFELLSTAGKQSRNLRDVASGTVDPSGQITLNRIDSAALTGAIQSPFRGTGVFSNNETNLSLNLKTVPSPHVSDNLAATASVKAVATGPKPSDTAVTGKETG